MRFEPRKPRIASRGHASAVERAIKMLSEFQRIAAGAKLARSLVDRVMEGTAVPELAKQRPPARRPRSLAAEREDLELPKRI